MSVAGLIPGGGPTKSDCYAELDITGITNPSDRVQKNKIVLCTDGDACDMGPCGDKTCDIRIRLCINQQDPNLGDCMPPSGLDRVTVTTKGKVKLNVEVPQLLEGPRCGALVDGTIPVKVKKKKLLPGKAKLKIAAKAPTGTQPRTDSDQITVKCIPRTVACPPSTTTTLIATTTTTASTSTTLPCVATSGCFCDTGDGTIRDTCTGLQWEKKDTVVGSGPNPADLHDVDNRYSWAGCCNGDCSSDANLCQPNDAAAANCMALSAGGTAGCGICPSGTCDVDPYGAGAITTVWDWLTQLNAASFAGHSDWRLPSEAACNSCWSPTGCSSCNLHELETILLAPSPCGTNPCIAPIFGPTASFDNYWSSASDASTPKFAWFVSFLYGLVGGDFKTTDYHVRAVRGSS